MNTTDVRATVTRVLIDETDRANQVEVTPRTLLADGGLALSSLSFMRVLIRLEDEFGIELDDTAVMGARLTVVEDLMTVVRDGAAGGAREEIR